LLAEEKGKTMKAEKKVLDLIWGSREIGKDLNIPGARVQRLHDEGKLPFVKKVGGQLCAERGAMRRYFIGDEPPKAA
jgi:hypothetical protein